MELIYLWIDGYKNLKNFEITLNSSYKGIRSQQECKNGKFKIILKERPDCLNIFGKNLNIMTLIGQNGSGKSNIINALSSILRNISLCHNTSFYDENEYDDNEIPKNCKFCLIIKLNGKFSAYCSDNCINDIEIELKTKENDVINAEYHDVPNSKYLFRKRKLDQSTTKINAAKFQPFYRKDDSTPVDFTRWNGIEDISKIKLNNYFYYDRFRLYDTVRNLIEIYEFNKKNKLKIFTEEKRLLFNKYSPYLDIYEALGWAYERIKNKTPMDGVYPIISLLGEKIQIIRTKIKNNSYLNERIDCLLEDILPTLFLAYTLGEIFNLIENYEIEKNLEYKIKDTIGIKANGETSDCMPKKLTREARLRIYTRFNNVLFGQRPIPNGLFKIDAKLPNNNDSERLKNMLTAYIDYEAKQTKKDFLRDYYELLKGKIIQLKEPVNFEDINEPYITEIEALKGISKNLYMENDKNFYDFMSLSTGEQRILRFFADVYYCAAGLENEYETNVFLFDEIDLSWHPEWQRKMVYYIKDIFDNIIMPNSERKINLIFTTHSPFILSDMPSNNVVLLARNKNGNTVVDSNKNDTFGANIHTLLAKSFFMKSTMGAFAQKKIQEAAQELNNNSKEEKNDVYQQVIKLLDDDNIYKKILERMNCRSSE
ncbi:MAG: ATP-binding protein, partial [Candidatus Gastranaerophilales bacterium]|nr:ATP-binding protein [Candidatus Gastranaerophilales bacterium]